MANTLTGLIPDLYAGLDVVSRELVGFIPAVARNSSAERASLDDGVTYHSAPTGNKSAIVPAMAVPDTTDQDIGKGKIIISKSEAAEFGYTGEEQLGLNNGPGFLTVQADQFAQAIRTLTNQVELDLSAAAYVAASRAHGTAGATPFSSNLGDSAQVRKILDDNGAPGSDRHMVINTTSGANLRTLGQLTKANEAADTSMLRQGVLLDLHGFAIVETGQGMSHTKGTGSGVLVNGTLTVGATTITADGGSGTIVAGDVVTIAGDGNKYVVTGALSGGSFTIGAPGLMAIPADNAAITVGNNFDANVAFQRGAIQLATRAPAKPEEGDLAIDSIMVVDPRSGLAFEVSTYPGYRKVRYEVALAWGWKVVKPAHVALMLG